MSRPVIFISYSHKDEDWKDRILIHLGIAQKQELFDVWDDRRIKGGEDWFEAITGAIDAGRIGILLVSANSLTSDFILKDEIPRLLDKRGVGKLRLYPVIISLKGTAGRLERLMDLCAITIVTSRVSIDPTTDTVLREARHTMD